MARDLPRTDEAIFGIGDNTVRARTVKRQTMAEAWSAEDLLAIMITPWKTGTEVVRHELTVQDDTEIEVVKEDRAEGGREMRRMRITRQDIEDIGYSDGCVGCSALRSGTGAQRHSEYRRRRGKEHLRGTQDGTERIEKAENKITEALVRAGKRIEAMGRMAASRSSATRADT